MSLIKVLWKVKTLCPTLMCGILKKKKTMSSYACGKLK